MMKRIIRLAALLLSLACLCSCSQGEDVTPGDVRMLARLTAIGEKLEVEVIEGEYGASGIFWVILSDTTEIRSADGKTASREDLKVGDTLEISYGGQVMMSYPPQIVALKIAVK